MNEAIEHLKQEGAEFFPSSFAPQAIELMNVAFQQIKAAILPRNVSDFYMCYDGAILGDACVFPIRDIVRENPRYVIPSVVKINRDLSHIQLLRGKTVWGRNQLYFFSADITGALYIHDVLTLKILKKYDNFGAALIDCLMVGKV